MLKVCSLFDLLEEVRHNLEYQLIKELKSLQSNLDTHKRKFSNFSILRESK